jgi:hypothetical protein
MLRYDDVAPKIRSEVGCSNKHVRMYRSNYKLSSNVLLDIRILPIDAPTGGFFCGNRNPKTEL